MCTTLVPIFGELAFREYPPGRGPQTTEERAALMGIYAPYFILPAAFVLRCVQMPAAARAKAKGE